jgi:hypothetical protein
LLTKIVKVNTSPAESRREIGAEAMKKVVQGRFEFWKWLLGGGGGSGGAGG